MQCFSPLGASVYELHMSAVVSEEDCVHPLTNMTSVMNRATRINSLTMIMRLAAHAIVHS